MVTLLEKLSSRQLVEETLIWFRSALGVWLAASSRGMLPAIRPLSPRLKSPPRGC